MKSIIKIICVAIALSGCLPPSPPAPPPVHPEWVAKVFVDEFSDKSFCRVALHLDAKASLQERILFSSPGYEFIAEMRDDGPRIGVWSRYGVFPGDVQIRVDSNPFVLVTAQDTPVVAGTQQVFAPPIIKLPNVTEEQQKAYEESVRQATETMTQNIQAIGSPYRVTTGEKTKSLLAQIKIGEQLKFRLVGVNKVVSGTGRFDINEQFKDALRKCKII